MMRTLASIMLLAVIAACGPVSPETAKFQCTERARDVARGPQGEVGIGVGSGGKVHTGVSVGISLDALQGRSPEEVYESCMRQKTGAAPTEPLVL